MNSEIAGSTCIHQRPILKYQRWEYESMGVDKYKYTWAVLSFLNHNVSNHPNSAKWISQDWNPHAKTTTIAGPPKASLCQPEPHNSHMAQGNGATLMPGKGHLENCYKGVLNTFQSLSVDSGRRKLSHARAHTESLHCSWGLPPDGYRCLWMGTSWLMFSCLGYKQIKPFASWLLLMENGFA